MAVKRKKRGGSKTCTTVKGYKKRSGKKVRSYSRKKKQPLAYERGKKKSIYNNYFISSYYIWWYR